jgi:hypothetical protein
VRKLLSAEERMAMERTLVQNPLGFPLIPATGGFRKARWSRGNRGKSAGVRTIFYYFVSGETIFLELIYAKNEKENLTRQECGNLSRLAAQIERGRA